MLGQEGVFGPGGVVAVRGREADERDVDGVEAVVVAGRAQLARREDRRGEDDVIGVTGLGGPVEKRVAGDLVRNLEDPQGVLADVGTPA